MHSEPLQRSDSFPTGDSARLKLSNIRGRVDVRAGEPGTISVTAIKRDPDLAGVTTVEIAQAEDGTVHVHTHFPNRHGGWLAVAARRTPSRVDYTVRVPPTCDVELSVVECDTTVAGLSGSLNLHTVSGRLRLADLAGSLSVHTVSGEVLGERLAAPGGLRLNAVSGRVTLLDSDLPAVNANSVSGDLTLQTRLGAGPYVFHSVSGDVRLSLPPDTRCAVSLHSQSGRVRSNIGFTRAGEAGRPTVRLHSVSGDLWLAGSPSEPTAEPPAAPLARRDVLERIARGELSVEGGVAALRTQFRPPQDTP